MKPDRGGKMAGWAAAAPKSEPVAAAPLWPIAERGLDERQRRHRRRIRAQDSRAEAQAQNARTSEDRGPLVVVEAAFGADEKADAVLRADFAQRVERARLRRLLVAEDDEPLGRPMRERLFERLGRGDLRRPDHAALLAGFDRVGAQTLEIYARDLGATGDE